jgi:predicted PurR-regulated permease PerM
MTLPSDPRTVYLGGLFGLALLGTFYVAAEIVLPVILAIVLKLLFQPLVRLLERFYVPRLVGALLSVLIVLGIFAGGVSLLATPAASWAEKLPEAIPKLRDQMSFLRQPIEMVQSLSRQIDTLTSGGGGQPPPGGGPAIKPLSMMGFVFSNTAAIVSELLTALLVLFYLLIAGETFLRRLVEVLPRYQEKRTAVELAGHIERDVSAYLLTVTCINAVVGIATGTEMWLCGMPSPTLWGALAFALNYVPILGPMTGIVLFLMAGVLSLGVSWWAILPAGIYLCIHVVEGEFATPMVLARRFTVNPVAMILSLVFWYWMWGVAGAILAMPLLAITKIVCDDLQPLRAVGHLLEA